MADAAKPPDTQRPRAPGAVVARRASPLQGSLLEVFEELVYFTRVFPHRNLTLEVLLVDVEEWRYPRRNRRRPWRRQFAVADHKLLAVQQTLKVTAAADLRQFIACPLPDPFHTAHLSAGLNIPRWAAQRIAYVLRKSGAAETVGKQRGAWLYHWNEATPERRAA